MECAAQPVMGWLEPRLGSSPKLLRLSGANDRLVGGRISSVEDALPRTSSTRWGDERSPFLLRRSSRAYGWEPERNTSRALSSTLLSSTASRSHGGRTKTQAGCTPRYPPTGPDGFWTLSCCVPRASGSRGSVPHAPCGTELQVALGDGAGARIDSSSS